MESGNFAVPSGEWRAGCVSFPMTQQSMFFASIGGLTPTARYWLKFSTGHVPSGEPNRLRLRYRNMAEKCRTAGNMAAAWANKPFGEQGRNR